MTHEAQSLHLRYGLVIALSTLNSSRYLNEPKTRFPVGRLFPLPGRELHPLKAPGLSWSTEDSTKGRVAHDPTETCKIGPPPGGGLETRLIAPIENVATARTALPPLHS